MRLTKKVSRDTFTVRFCLGRLPRSGAAGLNQPKAKSGARRVSPRVDSWTTHRDLIYFLLLAIGRKKTCTAQVGFYQGFVDKQINRRLSRVAWFCPLLLTECCGAGRHPPFGMSFSARDVWHGVYLPVQTTTAWTQYGKATILQIVLSTSTSTVRKWLFCASLSTTKTCSATRAKSPWQPYLCCASNQVTAYVRPCVVFLVLGARQPRLLVFSSQNPFCTVMCANWT